MNIYKNNVIADSAVSTAAGVYAMAQYSIVAEAAINAATAYVGATVFVTAFAAKIFEGILNKMTGIHPRLNPQQALLHKAISHIGAAAAGLYLAGKIGLIATASIPFWPTALVGGAVIALAPVASSFLAKLIVNRALPVVDNSSLWATNTSSNLRETSKSKEYVRI